MRTILKAAAVALLALALGACGTVSTPAVQAKLTGKSITVVSVVGETVRLSWRGTTVFNNEFGEARVSDWGLRTRVEDRAVAMLEASKRFTNVQRAQITATRREEALEQVEDLKTGSSHVLLISPNESGDSIFNSSVGFEGLGVAQRSILRMGP
jgi:curli biogenesis system outer membrane secretion channel CsgG